VVTVEPGPGQEKTKRSFFDANGVMIPVDTVVVLMKARREDVLYWFYDVISVPDSSSIVVAKPGVRIKVPADQALAWIGK